METASGSQRGRAEESFEVILENIPHGGAEVKGTIEATGGKVEVYMKMDVEEGRVFATMKLS